MTEQEFQQLKKQNPQIRIKGEGGDSSSGVKPTRVGVKGIIRQSMRQQNSTEIRFENDHLRVMRHTGEIRGYRFESIRLKLGNGHWYKSDFQAVNAAGTLIFFEVKGGRPRQREAGIGNIKTAANQYPEFEFWLCCYKGGEWLNQRVLP